MQPRQLRKPRDIPGRSPDFVAALRQQSRGRQSNSRARARDEDSFHPGVSNQLIVFAAETNKLTVLRALAENKVAQSPKSIRVAIDARYVRGKPSGIGSYVQALVDHLPSLGASDRFHFWRHPLARRPLSPAPNASEVTVRPGPNSPLTTWWPEHFASFDGIDVFHGPHNLMPRNVKCASVVTIHDLMALERPNLHLHGVERWFHYTGAVWRALREATFVIAPSQATADRICAMMPAAATRVTVIWEAAEECFRPGEDLSAAQKQAASLLGGEWPYLLVVGANVPTKRHDLALEAFAASVPPPWRLVFVQRRKKSERLMRRGRDLHIEDRLIWSEAIALKDLVALLQGAGALIQPSVYEGFGLPVLEAMACGCPVVCSDIPALREITAGAALLVRPEELESLASALRQLIAAPELRCSLAGQGLARARTFSWHRCARETLEVYRAAAAR